MMQILFFLRFQTQLRSTRPEIIISLEEAVSGAIKAAGGKIEKGRRVLTASFDIDTMAFALDVITVLDQITKALKNVSGYLFGYSVVLSMNIPEYQEERICRILSSETRSGENQFGSGIWCDEPVRKVLEPYAYFSPSLSGEMPSSNALSSARRAIFDESSMEVLRRPGLDISLVKGYARLIDIRSFSGPPGEAVYPFRVKIEKAIRQGQRRNVLLVGPDFMGKRDGLNNYLLQIMGGAPVLKVRFGLGCRSLCCLIDALNPSVRAFITGGIPEETLKTLDELGLMLFRERLRTEFTIGEMEIAVRFFKLLLESYIFLFKGQKICPALVLENLHLADEQISTILVEIWDSLPNADRKNLLVYGFYRDDNSDKGISTEKQQFWGNMFPRIIKFSSGNFPSGEAPQMAKDLWEMAYAFSLFGLYFPGVLFLQLFEEGGKNPAMIRQALTMLFHLGIIDSFDDPSPRIRNFIPQAEKILGKDRERVHLLILSRLLAWVQSGKLRPCFNLLKAIIMLGGEGENELLFRLIHADVMRGAYTGIEEAIRDYSFKALVGQGRAEVLLFLFNTLRALYHGDLAAIQSAFSLPSPDEDIPEFKTRIQINWTQYYFGTGNLVSAVEAVKGAMLIGQNLRKEASPAYRMFSLVSLSSQHIEDAIEYLNFAMESAEKAGQFDELGKALYFSAVAQFLYGNCSKALRLSLQAEETFRREGCEDWADRAGFFSGRLQFEIGHYREALDAFESLVMNTSWSDEKASVVSAWIYRTKVYLQNSLAAKPSYNEGDIRLFELEASYLTRDYQNARTLADALLEKLPEDGFLYTERPDWRSGFSQCEFFTISQTELWRRQIFSYRAMALSRLSLTSEVEVAKDNLRNLMRDDQLSTDPNDSFYCYAYYRILHENQGHQGDMNTAVSMAFKRLHRRAGRIDDVETRKDFLSLHYWNSSLSLVAKEYKLI
jgi:tetratricopeptide (TPR) repeat protein